jgi:hypothetical protein
MQGQRDQARVVTVPGAVGCRWRSAGTRACAGSMSDDVCAGSIGGGGAHMGQQHIDVRYQSRQGAGASHAGAVVSMGQEPILGTHKSDEGRCPKPPIHLPAGSNAYGCWGHRLPLPHTPAPQDE